ncbi:toxin-antitoxin system TumE family protein [Aliarcobacter butzleri]|uniref:toxin-antitoxin system TumE family protein n=1 Tax=Aliarcobacter butzleri TaxID=28197 RepID=UPI0028769443|nr:DUF6516 family protein [Aliarcobacter butzleri]MDS1315806.1 DUF6516 family protein [Aliarcobacter butzleri]
MKYSYYEDTISLVNDGVLDEFADTICLRGEYDLYFRIGKIDEYTKLIREYALGVQDRRNKKNIIRFDDADHHNDKSKVNGINPPHHKHHGKHERVEGCSGDLKDIVKELKEKIKNLR